MKEQGDSSSADKKADKVEENQRKAELAKQKRRRELSQAIYTVKVLERELVDTGSGQAEYYVDSEVKGLDQLGGETNEELFKRAVGICRAHGLSAEEVSKRVLGRDPRLSTALNLGEISLGEKSDNISQLSTEIAKVYESLSQGE